MFFVALGLACAGVLGFSGSAGAQDSQTVGDSAEGWYSSPVECTSPVGCPPVALESYPAGTLHVAVQAGHETARTYLAIDLSSLPSGEMAVSGMMTLPLATVQGNGNSSTSSATIEACLAKAPFADGSSGSTDAPPATDCSVKGSVKVGASAFSLDVTPFLTAWNAGTPDYGIALFPDQSGSNALTNWHVAFNGKDLKPPITTVLTLGQAGADSGGSSAGSAALYNSIFGTGTSSGGAPAAGSSSPSSSPLAVFPATTGSPGAPAAAPAIASTPAQVSPVGGSAHPAPGAQPAQPAFNRAAVIGSGGFQYPEILLLPLFLAAGAAYAIRTLTSDATPRSTTAP